jgi:two-component system, sensor histidine kinase RegB
MMTNSISTQYNDNARQLRIDTLSKIRWLALFGQLVAVLITTFIFRFKLPIFLCIFVIATSSIVNIFVQLFSLKIFRLSDWQATALLTFDIFQLGALLYLTGGLENPFFILVLAPVTIAAVSLPPPKILLIASFMVFVVSFLTIEHEPLPWYDDQYIDFPSLYRFGSWIAIMVGCAFICTYASRVAGEARTLNQALTAVELVLARENHLSQLDGLAAAAAHELGTPLATIALVIKELSNASFPSEFSDDFILLRQEVQRSKSILSQLTSLSSVDQMAFDARKISILLEEIVAPHRQALIPLNIDTSGSGVEPLATRSPAIIYGIGNFIDNAVDFAKTRVMIEARWTETMVEISIIDDGPGFSVNVIDRIGEPYITSHVDRRIKTEQGSGLGLGVFIAKTLLERTGAEIRFSNGAGGGAIVQMQWNRFRFENPAV